MAIAAMSAVTVAGPGKSRVRLKAGVVVGSALAAFGCLVPLAPTASANTKSNWSKVVDGIEIGWTNNHAWAIASYATVIRLGAGKAAGVACGAVLPEEPKIDMACDTAVEKVVASLVKGHPSVTNHGIWVAVYPSAWGRFSLTEGRY